MAIDQVEVWQASEPEPESELTQGPAPVEAPESALTPPPEPAATEGALMSQPVPEPRPAPEAAGETEPQAETEVTAAPEPHEPQPEPAAAPERSAEADAMAEPDAARADPAEMLRRILAIIRPPEAASADSTESQEGDPLVATIAVSEVEEPGNATTGSTPSRGNAPPSGPLSVDQAVSELLLKALARAAAATQRAHARAAPASPDLPGMPAPEPVTPERARVTPMPPADDLAITGPTPPAAVAKEVPAEEAQEAAAILPAAPAAVADTVVPPAPAEQASPPATAVVLPLPQPAILPRPEGLAAFRALSDEDKIALFS